MTSVAERKGLVVIAEDLREAFGWGDEGEIIEIEHDGQVEAYLLPPPHSESLMGSLAPYSDVTISEDEWPEARERAWREAVQSEAEFSG